MGERNGQDSIGIAIEQANEYVPEVVAYKLQHIARENDVQSIELALEREIDPLWDQTFFLPRNSRAWFYDGGKIWLLFSDGDIFAEPIKQRDDMNPPPFEGAVWIITLDDAAEHLRVSQCFLSTSGQYGGIKHAAANGDRPVAYQSRKEAISGNDGGCEVRPLSDDKLAAKFLVWNGERMAYSIAFDVYDPEGDEQIDAEEQIAAHFHDYYEDEEFDLTAHVRWVISFVVETFFRHDLSCQIEDILQLTKTLQEYLSTWQCHLAKKMMAQMTQRRLR